MEAEMKVLLSGISIAALLTWGLPVWSPANAMTGQAHNEQGYNFAHPTGDADNVPVRAEVKYDGVATRAAVGGVCTSRAKPVIGAGL